MLAMARKHREENKTERYPEKWHGEMPRKWILNNRAVKVFDDALFRLVGTWVKEATLCADLSNKSTLMARHLRVCGERVIDVTD